MNRLEGGSLLYIMWDMHNTHTHTHTHTCSIGIVRPLQQFLAGDLEQVKVSKKAYYKAQSEAHQITEKFGQVLVSVCLCMCVCANGCLCVCNDCLLGPAVIWYNE